MNRARGLVALLFVMGSSVSSGLPHSFEKKEITGVVKMAVWRSGFSYRKVKFEDGKWVKDEITTVDQWMVVLDNVDGLTEAEKRSVTFAFGLNEPAEPSLKCNPETQVFLCFKGSENLELKEGQRIKLTGVKYLGDERGAGLTTESVAKTE